MRDYRVPSSKPELWEAKEAHFHSAYTTRQAKLCWGGDCWLPGSCRGSVPLADDGSTTDSQIERIRRRASAEPLFATGMKGGLLIDFGRTKVEFKAVVD